MSSTEAVSVGKVALVTGAASGIGAAVAKSLDTSGYQLMLVDRNPAVAAVAEELREASSLQLDIGAPDSAQEIVGQTLAKFGHLDALVNNAGVGGPNRDVSSLSRDLLQPVFEVNLFSMLDLCREAERPLVESAGAIVNIGSLFADHPVRSGAAYSMTKAAVHNLTRVLALELGPRGVRVNAVAPGYILTDMHLQEVAAQAEALGISAEDHLASLRKEVPLGRHGTPEDIAEVVTWLLGGTSDYVHGQILAVNGGLTLT